MMKKRDDMANYAPAEVLSSRERPANTLDENDAIRANPLSGEDALYSVALEAFDRTRRRFNNAFRELAK
jgi:hypothetical protein